MFSMSISSISIDIGNVGIILVVIGAVSLLVALVGGGFHTKWTDIPKISPIPRVGVFLFGVVLLVFGIVLSTPVSPKSNPAPNSNAPANSNSNAPANPPHGKGKSGY